MIQLKQWYHETWDENLLGTILNLTDFPKQYPVKKLTIRIEGEFDVTAGGTTDYDVNQLLVPRIIKNLQFKLGGNNLLKDVPGYVVFINTQLMEPTSASETHLGIEEGTTMSPGNQYKFRINYCVYFSDMDTIVSDATMLVPSLYEDISLRLTFPTMAELCPVGDRPFTIVDGLITVLLEQETNPGNVPSDILREYTLSTEVTSTGNLNIDLPTDSLVTRLIVSSEEDNIPNADPYDDDSPNGWKVDIESGSLILYDAYREILNSTAMQEYGVMNNGEDLDPCVPVGFNMNHDMRNIFDARKVTKWQLILPVEYSAPVTRDVIVTIFARQTA